MQRINMYQAASLMLSIRRRIFPKTIKNTSEKILVPAVG